MELSELGMEVLLAPSVSELMAVDRDRFLVRSEAGEVPAEVTGKLVHLAEHASDLPCVGDWVGVHRRDAGARLSIHCVLPRRSFLPRKVAGRDVDQQVRTLTVPGKTSCLLGSEQDRR
jgi:ribosome biogenesis GTPase / thiamine phosphate phosphatase